MKDFPGWCAWLFFIAGILFLLGDLGVWAWGINWWTVLFILGGLAAILSKK